ncbi:MAG: cysteine methyltransferase, partial [Methanomicrobium sp.]|nr:cysteine methyltransferase [Methanomicrobium sp.]
MDISTGICRFGLWRVRVEWSEEAHIIHRISFVRSGDDSPVPQVIGRYLSGKSTTFSPYGSIALSKGYPFYE